MDQLSEIRASLCFELNNMMQQFSPPCAHQLIEASALLHPDTVALLAGRTQLTYRELNGRANQLAHFLREKGVGPEVLELETKNDFVSPQRKGRTSTICKCLPE